MTIEIDQERLTRELKKLAEFSSAEAPAVTRIVYSEEDRNARQFLKDLFAEAGLLVREDAMGNTFARWPGCRPEVPAVGTGSHIDAIPNAGRYDGTVGVLGGLEAIRALRRSGLQPKRSLELLLFTSEEPTRFGIGCLGSRRLAGMPFDEAKRNAVEEARTAAGFQGDWESVPLAPGYYSAFLELHIEQGPLLEQAAIDLGIVTAIAAPAALHVTFEGEGGHAGAVLMPGRRDAFLAAAELALAVEAAAKATGAEDTVATTGVCDIFPRAVNSIPSRANLEIDVRDIELERRDRVLAAIGDAAEEIARRRSVVLRKELFHADRPAECDPRLVAVFEQACRTHRASFRRMISRAYHDSLFMARIAPAAMLFIPCRGGISHRPDEYASPEAIAQGTLILAEALANLAQGAD